MAMSDKAKNFNFKAWQLVFLSGAAGALTLAYLVFGFSGISQSIVTVGVILALLDHLLRPKAGEGGDTKIHEKLFLWLQQRLNRKIFLVTATAAAWIVVTSLGVYGIIALRRQALEVERTERTFSLEGFVLTAGGRPADFALVTIELNGLRESVPADMTGKFRLPAVDVSLVRGRVKLEATWKGLAVSQSIDNPKSRLSPVLLRLPPGDPPFRVSYLTLDGFAPHFLAQKRLANDWAKETFDGPVHVADTPTLQVLSKLVERFSSTFDLEIFRLKLGSVDREYIELAKNSQGENFFVGGWPRDLNRPASAADLLNLPKQGWSLEFQPRASWVEPQPLRRSRQDRRIEREEEQERLYFTAGQLFFWRPALLSDINSLPYDGPWVEFYAEIMRGPLPRDFGFMVAKSYCEFGCAYIGCDTSLSFVHRMLAVNVAIIQNTTAGPISFDKFIVHQSGDNYLRGRSDDDAALSASASSEKVLLPGHILLPRENLIVPLSMSFRFSEDNEFLPPHAAIEKRTALASEIGKMKEVVFPLAGADPLESTAVALGSADLQAPLKQPSAPLHVEDEYLYGPSLRLDSAVLEGVAYPIRGKNLADRELWAGYLGASCPFVYTVSADGMLDYSEGHILSHGEEREEIEEKQLRYFDGRVLIKELEDEVSFIDEMEIRVENVRGSVQLLEPDDDLLREADSRYLTLRRGEQRLVRFPEFRVSNGDLRYILKVKGYYVKQ
jgi:hypothetical protein